jgi:hypothetical protein
VVLAKVCLSVLAVLEADMSVMVDPWLSVIVVLELARLTVVGAVPCVVVSAVSSVRVGDVAVGGSKKNYAEKRC